jgi:hypothetical protein
MLEKREIYLHISEKSCTFATAKISFSQSAIISRGFSRVVFQSLLLGRIYNVGLIDFVQFRIYEKFRFCAV